MTYTKDQLKDHMRRGGNGHDFGTSNGASWGQAQQDSESVRRELDKEDAAFRDLLFGDDKGGSGANSDAGSGGFFAILGLAAAGYVLFEGIFTVFVYAVIIFAMVASFVRLNPFGLLFSNAILSSVIAWGLIALDTYGIQHPTVVSALTERSAFDTGSALTSRYACGLFVSALLTSVPYVGFYVQDLIMWPLRRIVRASLVRTQGRSTYRITVFLAVTIAGGFAAWLWIWLPVLGVHWTNYIYVAVAGLVTLYLLRVMLPPTKDPHLLNEIVQQH